MTATIGCKVVAKIADARYVGTVTETHPAFGTTPAKATIAVGNNGAEMKVPVSWMTPVEG